jgi:hypothetical protein
MKKRTRKLNLSRETLKNLAQTELAAPEGAATREDWVNQPTVSGCTCPETGCGTGPTLNCTAA